MKHLTFGDKTLFVGDAAAATLQAMSDLRVPPITEMSSEQLSALADPLDEGTTSQG